MPTKKSASAQDAPAKAAKVRKPRQTAAERRAAEEARREEQRLEAEARRVAFEATRPGVWFEIFAKALRVSIISEQYSEVLDEHSWWFNDFHVDARAQSVRTENVWNAVTLDSLREDQVLQLNEGLDQAMRWFDEHDEKQERLRQEALALAERRKAARAKLTDQEAKDLGLR